MDEKKTTSSWDDLIKQVGAEPAADALERKRPAIETTFEPPAIDASAVKPKPGDWNALADTLGIESREPEPPRKSHRDTSQEAPGPSSNSLEASFAEIEPMESAFEEIIEEEISDIEFEEVDEDEDEEFAASSGESSGDPNALSGEAARNAFEALFGAGSFGALPPVKKPVPREPERPRGGPQWRDPNESRREEPHRPADRDEADELEREGGGGERSRGDEEGDRPRRRRRRRRGRGGPREDRGEPLNAPRAEDDADAWSESPGEEFGEGVEREHGEADEAEAGEKPERRRHRRRRRGRPGEAGDVPADRAAANGQSSRLAAEDDEDDEDAVESQAVRHDEDEGDDDELPRDSHKNIPTWAEAISVMVETNMQARKDSPSRPSSPRGRGRGRGRGGSGGRRGRS